MARTRLRVGQWVKVDAGDLGTVTARILQIAGHQVAVEIREGAWLWVPRSYCTPLR